MNNTNISDTVQHLLSEQENIRLPLPMVVQNKDYAQRRELLERMNELLLLSGIEDQCMRTYVAQQQAQQEEPLRDAQRVHAQKTARRALRCNVLKCLSDESYRALSVHIADSPLMQWFIGLDNMTTIRVPSKSTLERYFHMFPETVPRGLSTQLALTGCADDDLTGSPLDLEQPLCMDVALADSTCVKLNIHYPVDWVMLRDGIISLIHSIECIRRHGLRHRMPEPKTFLKKVNNICIEMTHAKNKTSSKKDRKRILRVLKKLAKQVFKHGVRYRDILAEDEDMSGLSVGQKNQILGRIDNILEKLPAAIDQAHERIIGERQVKNADKMLSLYEPHTRVYKRGKSGAQVEYGLQLWIAENVDGFITDWQLVNGIPKNDYNHVQPCIERLQRSSSVLRPKVIVGDRGCSSVKNKEWLKEHGIEDALCPCSVSELKERLGGPAFRAYQTRRAQTEARIGILKANFLGKHLPAKGYERQNRYTSWCMLAHNLWVVARLPQKEKEADADIDVA